MTFFRYAMLSPDPAAQLDFTHAENPVIKLHCTVAKAGKHHFQARPITIACASGLLTFDTVAGRSVFA